jgi:aminoglycoside phosphotransferase (APT) family kinase protein
MDIGTAARRIRQDFVGLTIARIVPLGEGLGNVAFEVNDTYVFRFPKADVNVLDLQRELLILPVVRTHSTLPVPRPDFVPLDRSYVGYRKLPGRILMNATEEILARAGAAVGSQLGAFLGGIHGIRVAEFDSSAVRHELLCLKDCLASARGDYAQARTGIPTQYAARVERFLDASPPSDAWNGAAVFSHNDLGSEHVLVQNGVVSGIIDWGDTAVTDPAYDFGLLYRDLGPIVLEAALNAYARVHSAEKDQIRRRAHFFGRWRVLENITYGLMPQNAAYLDAALRSLRWLFPEHRAERRD